MDTPTTLIFEANAVAKDFDEGRLERAKVGALVLIGKCFAHFLLHQRTKDIFESMQRDVLLKMFARVSGAERTLRLASEHNDDPENRAIYRDAANELDKIADWLQILLEEVSS